MAFFNPPDPYDDGDDEFDRNEKVEGHRDEGLEDLLADDLVLNGRKFLYKKYPGEIQKAIGIVLKEKLQEEFISPKEVQELHPSITTKYASLCADNMTIYLTIRRITRELDGSATCPTSYMDIKQVLEGTSVGAEESLSALAYTARTSTKQVESEALARLWEFDSLRKDLRPSSRCENHRASPSEILQNGEELERDYLLSEQLEKETITALGALINKRLELVFLSPTDLRVLHPEVDDTFTTSNAYSMNLHLAYQKIRNELPDSRGGNTKDSSLRQVISGTLSAKRSSLNALAYVLETTSDSLIAEARERL